MRHFTVAWSSLLLAVLSIIVMPGLVAAQTFNPQPGQLAAALPDLTATVTASASTVGGGADVTYTVVVQNVAQVAYRDPLGHAVYWNAPASGISALFSLPSGSVFRSVSATAGFACAYVSPVVTCSGGSLASGATGTVTVVAAAPLGAGSFVGTVSVDPTNAIVERSESNNVASTGVNVPQPDLVVSVDASDASVEDQGSVTYWLHVDNPGPAADAANVTLRYTLPTGASLWSWRDGISSWLYGTFDQAGFACSVATGVVTCTGGHIPSAGRGSITLVVTAPRMNGTMTGTAVVDPSNVIAERNEANNAASTSTNVVGRVDLTVDVTHALFPLPLTRVVTVRNVGAGNATGAKVVIEATKWEYFDDGGPDVYAGVIVDSGFSCARSTYVAGSYINYHTGDVITCTGGSIPAGGTATIRVVHVLTTTDDSRNTDVTVDPDNTIREPFENNNHDTATTRI